jgi:gas vesicle protein
MEEDMSNQEFRSGASGEGRRSQDSTSKMRDAAGGAFSKASGMAKDAGAEARKVASDTASTVTDQVKELLDRQIESGADMAGQFASSAKLAADDLSRQSPLLGGFVRSFAEKVDEYANDLQDQTVEQLARAASDFTRRQPALVFGLAALAGFFMFRTMKSAPSTAAPPIQPDHGSPMQSSHPQPSVY